MKKILCCLLTLVIAFGFCVIGHAADPGEIPDLKAKFADAEGPEVNGLSVDYVYYAPENPSGKKLPLVVYFHGAAQGFRPRAQIEENNFPLWASEEIQQRFSDGGAYLLVPRSHEERSEFWSDKYVEVMKATIDDFIAKNESVIDLARIYVGGFSMGGKMTFKMASSYPDFFAAAFPMCPAYEPSSAQIEAMADMPIWLIVSRFDIIAGYYTYSKAIWSEICEKTDRPADCRLTLFGRVKSPDGKNTPSNHFVWFAFANDLFTYDGGKYPNAVTCDAGGNEIELTSPDGVVSWLNAYSSDYSGQALAPNGTLKANPDRGYDRNGRLFMAIIPLVVDAVKTFFSGVLERVPSLGR